MNKVNFFEDQPTSAKDKNQNWKEFGKIFLIMRAMLKDSSNKTRHLLFDMRRNIYLAFKHMARATMKGVAAGFSVSFS